MNRIKILKEDTISKIAAGEVVERPASAVKELVENSIDAGSDSVQVEVESAGRGLIRVADNGCGMAPEDARLAFHRYATSKILDAGDLENVRTLGFRGEALASIASVSQVDIMSRSEDSENGIYAYVESGEVLKTRPVGRARGTTIEVRNLFYNVPARKKFLKKDSTELSEIVNMMGRFIVSCPGVEFKLSHNERTLLHAVRSAGPLERIRLVMGADVSENMVEVLENKEGVCVSGFVSRPTSTRKDSRSQMFFVNGRFVKSKVLSGSLYTAYRSMLERGRYPAAVLFLDISPDACDVNVHPGKLEIKFDRDNDVRDAVCRAVDNTFSGLKGRTPVAPGGQSPEPTAKEVPGDDTQEVQNEFSYEPRDPIGKTVSTERVEKTAPEGITMSPAWSDIPVPGAERVFQIAGCYILQFSRGGILITDQHAAHERILYEFFSARSKEGRTESQNLLFPVHIDLSASETVLMEKLIDDFRKLGFSIEVFGERSYIVRAVPSVLKDRDIKDVIYDIMSDIKQFDLKKIDALDELAKLMACKAAIKSGDEINTQEMVMLLEQLGECELPFTCPHGRPTVTEITLEELEKRFHRK